MKWFRRIALTCCVLWLACATGGCSTNPATGESQFAPISYSQESSMGAEAGPQFLKSYGGEVPDAQILAYVRGVGQSLLVEAEAVMKEHLGNKAPKYQWEFHVVDSSVINAFALPGGKVFISRALLVVLEDESQLAGVLGHEIGHVTARHIAQQMGRATLIKGALVIGAVAAGVATEGGSTAAQMAALGVKGAEVGGSVYLLKFGRDQETQADSLGIEYMTRVGYNPVGQMRVMQILGKVSQGSRPPEFLSTHPYPETRVKNIDKIIKKDFPDYKDPNKYKFNQEAFKANVLDRIAKLPPPKHNPK